MKKYCNRNAEELKTIEQVRISDLHHITSLQTIFRIHALSFDKYNTDVIDSLNQEDKNKIGGIVKGATEAVERCEDTTSRLKALIRKKSLSKSESDVLRGELDNAITTIQCFQTSFNMLVSRPLNEVVT